jgi:hypothetical protein
VKITAAGPVTLQTPCRNDTTHLVMSPLEFMQGLAAIAPQPGLPLIRFNGAPEPNARLRTLTASRGTLGREEATAEGAAAAEGEGEGGPPLAVPS